jgi:hypothetical protein
MDYLFDHLIPTLEEDGAGAIVDDIKEAYYWLGQPQSTTPAKGKEGK